MTADEASQGMRTFLVIWIGQVVSIFGSNLSNFGLGVWVFQETRSVTAFSVAMFVSTVPALLLTPVAGPLVDRWNRRRTMVVSDVGAAVAVLVVAGLVATDALRYAHIIAAMTVIAVCNSFQQPAFQASVTLLVPKRHLGRASGLNQAGGALARIVAPMVAGSLLVLLGLLGLVLIDFATFLVAMVTLMLVRVPQPRPASGDEDSRASLLREAAAAWSYVRQRPGLVGLLSLYAASNVSLGMVLVLLTPMVLSFASPAGLGVVLSVGSAGVLVGAVAMSALGEPRHRVRTILLLSVVQGLILILVGTQQQVAVLAAAAFVFLALNPVIETADLVLWQSKIPPRLQGRIFALRRLFAGVAAPLAYLVAGPLADRVFEPLMAPSGALAASLGPIFGTGEGRGIGVMFSLLGVALMLTAAGAALFPRLRRVEAEVPDAIPDAPETEPPRESN